MVLEMQSGNFCLLSSVDGCQPVLASSFEDASSVRSVGVFSTDKVESHKISLGKYFVSEILVCRTELISSIGQSPISPQSSEA